MLAQYHKAVFTVSVDSRRRISPLARSAAMSSGEMSLKGEKFDTADALAEQQRLGMDAPDGKNRPRTTANRAHRGNQLIDLFAHSVASGKLQPRRPRRVDGAWPV